jgi:hypothetical protein
MIDFIRTQYKLYKIDQNSIDIEKIKLLAQLYLSISEYNEMFGENSIQEQSLDKIESV